MSILAANSQILYREVHQRDQQQQPQQQILSNGGCFFLNRNSGSLLFDRRNIDRRRISRRELRVEAGFWPDLSRPVVEMEPINDSDHLDQILLQAREQSQTILIDWMAAWCRKCIYLKPKLEKLAAEYDTKIDRVAKKQNFRVKFYCVDVNKVPQTLVKRGNITLWKDGEMKEEVIGGHKAWLVIEEVREMIQKFV